MAASQFGTVCLALAVIQAFSANYARKLFPLLGHVELSFPCWGLLALIYLLATEGWAPTFHFVNELSFLEPLFVLVVMAVSGTRVILRSTEYGLGQIARWMPLAPPLALYVTVLTFGPLAGSFLTEPAAMTVSALVLRQHFFSRSLSTPLMYATLGLLFVNVSIGGMLTNFAAPPVLMVARVWHWDAAFMGTHFVPKVLIAIVLSTALVAAYFRREILTIPISYGRGKNKGLPTFKENLRAAGLVAIFLCGLTVLGPFQTWWLEPVLRKLSGLPLFLSAIGLTSILDNAALTYLGAQIPDLPELDRYLIVAGAVAGGGLSIIANAPNPAGYALLNQSFRARSNGRGIEALPLCLAATIPTLIAAACLYFG